MPLHDLPGSDKKGKFKIQKSNLEQEQNETNAEMKTRGFPKYPMHVHKQGGLVREVANDDDLADALAKGWYDDIRNVPSLEPKGDPNSITGMTVAQAKKALAKATVEELIAFEADEAAHGARADVMAAIAEAKDNIGGGKPAPKAGKKK